MGVRDYEACLAFNLVTSWLALASIPCVGVLAALARCCRGCHNPIVLVVVVVVPVLLVIVFKVTVCVNIGSVVAVVIIHLIDISHVVDKDVGGVEGSASMFLLA